MKFPLIAAMVIALLCGAVPASSDILTLGGHRLEVVDGRISDEDARRVIAQFEARYQRKDFDDDDLEKLIARYNGAYLPEALFLLAKMKFMRSSYGKSFDIFTKLLDRYDDHNVVRSGEFEQTVDRAVGKLIYDIEEDKDEDLRLLDTLVRFAVLRRYVSGRFPDGFAEYFSSPYSRRYILEGLDDTQGSSWVAVGKSVRYSGGSDCRCCAEIKPDRYEKRSFPATMYDYYSGFWSHETMRHAEFVMLSKLFYAAFFKATWPEAEYVIDDQLQQYGKKPERLAVTMTYYVEPDGGGSQRYELKYRGYNWKILEKYGGETDFGWPFTSECREQIVEKADWFQSEPARNIRFLNLPATVRVKYFENVDVWRRDDGNLYLRLDRRAPEMTVDFPSLKALVVARHGSAFEWVGFTRSTTSSRPGGVI